MLGLVDCQCRDHPGLCTFGHGSDIENVSEISQIFILNILRFEFPNILLFLCLAIVKNVSGFLLINYVCRMGHIFT